MPGANATQLLAAIALSNVVACAPARGCLTSFPSPYVSREDLALLRREYRRAESAPPPMRARMLQALPGLLPDLSSRRDAPTCAPEILERVATDLDQRPLPYSNATLHEIRTLGQLEAAPVLERVSADQPIARWLFDRAPR